MRILIVGGTGVLSSAVTEVALKQGFVVTMINRGHRRIPDNVEHIKSDMYDHDTIASMLGKRKFDAVLDFLCFTEEQTEKSVCFYSKYTKQYFYISSCAVYDTAALDGFPSSEDSKKVLQIWKYSVDKWASEQKIAKLLDRSAVKYTIIRPCVTYGDTRIPYGISPMYGYHWTLCARILAGKPIITWNEGKNRCNMTRVEDFAVGVVGLIGNEKAYGEAFNVCGDETPSFRDVLDTLGNLLGKEVQTVDITPQFYARELPSRAGEILGGRSIDTINSNKKLKVAVPQFGQSISLHEGIKRTVDAYKNSGYQKGIDWAFDANTDRIIKKWCKQQKENVNKYNVGFVDYIGSSSLADRFHYYTILNQDIPFFSIYNKVINVRRSLTIRLGRLFH